MRNQTERIKREFQRRPFQWIPLPEIMPMAAQYNARIHELRGTGMNIVNKKQHKMGEVHSWFKYIPDTNCTCNDCYPDCLCSCHRGVI